MKLIVKKGRTSLLVKIFIQDSSSTTGAGLTGLTSASGSLVCYRARDDDGNAGGTAITLSGGTKGTWSSGGFVEKDATNMPGVYEFGVPDAAIATGSETCVIMLKGATNMAPLVLEIQLVAYDPQSTGLGLSNVSANVAQWNGSNVAAPNVSGVPKVDLIDVNGHAVTDTASGVLDVNAKNHGGTAQTGRDIGANVLLSAGTGTGQLDFTSGVVKGNVTQWSGQAVATVNTNGVPVVDTRQVIRQNTAQATGNSTTAIKLDASASATTDFYKFMRCVVISGTGAPESAIITAYDGTTKIATVSPAWPTAPDNTSVFQIIADAQADVETWKGSTAPAMTGDAFARLGAPAGASVSADVAAVKSDTGTILTDVNTGAGAIYTRIGAPAGASIAADIAALPTANGNADALLDRSAGVETGLTVRQWLRLAAAALLGKASGMATTTAVFRDTNDSKNRISATVDASGNRTAVTLDAS